MDGYGNDHPPDNRDNEGSQDLKTPSDPKDDKTNPNRSLHRIFCKFFISH
jgi:hypothetical protein